MKVGSREIDLIKIYILLMSLAVLALGTWVFLTYRSFDEYRIRHIRRGEGYLNDIVERVNLLNQNYDDFKARPPIDFEKGENEIYKRLDICAENAGIANFTSIADKQPKKKDWELYKAPRGTKGQRIELKTYTVSFKKTNVPLEQLVRFLYSIENNIPGVKVTKVGTNKIGLLDFQWEDPIIEIAFFRKAEKKKS